MNKSDLVRARESIEALIHHTPVLTSRQLREMSGVELYFKCENFQRMGAFKMRGACNALLNLTDKQKGQGVVTHSSGNFAQALSLSAQILGVTAHIVMPENASEVKKDAVRGYGGNITLCTKAVEDRERTVEKVIEHTGATFVHPSNDDQVILGNATAGMELIEEQSDLHYILVPVGGGGLLAGTALAAHFFGENIKVIGGEPVAVDDAFRSLQSGKIEYNITTDTIADGLKTHLGDHNFPIIKKYVDRIIRVEEDEIVQAMRLIWERMKIIVESSSAVAFAALLKEKERFKGRNVGIILSGGNVDLSRLPF